MIKFIMPSKSKAVQQHGNDFENEIHLAIHGTPKDKYEKLIEGGYTAKYDIVKGTLSNSNFSIKVTKSNSVACGDIIRMLKGTKSDSFILLVGTYTQKGKSKIYNEIFEFYIEPKHHKLLWGNMKIKELEKFVDYVKKIPHGKQAQLKNKNIWKEKRTILETNKGLMSIAAKIDSKKQRRTQCSLSLKYLLTSDIPFKKYTKTYKSMNLPYTQKNSPKRTFN